jgi:hypothetical protein
LTKAIVRGLRLELFLAERSLADQATKTREKEPFLHLSLGAQVVHVGPRQDLEESNVVEQRRLEEGRGAAQRLRRGLNPDAARRQLIAQGGHLGRNGFAPLKASRPFPQTMSHDVDAGSQSNTVSGRRRGM